MCTHLLVEACAPRAEVERVSVPILLGANQHQAGHLVCFLHAGASRLASFWLCEPSLFVVVGVSFADMH